MDKIPLPVKIFYWLVIIISTPIAYYWFIKALEVNNNFVVIGRFLTFVAFLIPPALCASILFSHCFSRHPARSVYWPGNNVELLPPEYSDIRSNIVKGDYYKAIDKLEAKIKEEPKNPIPVALLSDIYIDHIKKYSDAIIVLSNFLNKPERTEKDVAFVMKLVDVLLEINESQKAYQLLNREVTLDYDKKALIPLEKRLNGLKQSINM